MFAPFNYAWTILKQRGHELNLPNPQKQGVSPQGLTDRRVDMATGARQGLDNFENLANGDMRSGDISSAEEAMEHLKNRRLQQDMMEREMQNVSQNETQEKHLGHVQRNLDRETMTRMGQQPEADEMEEMGVPPMSRTLSATPPPNIGQAGSSGRPPVGRNDLNDDLVEDDPKFTEEYSNHLNQLGPLSNPFPAPAGRNVRDDLTDWAAGAGRESGMPQQTEFSKPPHMQGNPLHENNPAAHNIASTNLRGSPRQNKRGQMDEPRATPRMQGRAERSTSPFIGGQ